MVKKMKHLIIFLTVLLSHDLLSKIAVSSSVNPNTSINGEAVQYVFTITTDEKISLPTPKFPDSSDWDVVSVMSSRSSGFSFGSGGNSRETKAEYSFILKPLKTGKINIPKITLKINGQNFSSQKLTVNVKSLPTGNYNRNPIHRNLPRLKKPNMNIPNLFGGTGSNSQKIIPENKEDSKIFVKAIPSATTVYQGQMIDLEYSLFRNFRSFSSPEYKSFPQFEGFVKEDIQSSNRLKDQQVTIEDKDYIKVNLINYAIFPIKTGELKISPLVFSVTYNLSPLNMLDDILGGRFGTIFNLPQTVTKPETKELESNVVTIESLPLPPLDKNLTNTFSGGVGQFQLQQDFPTQEIKADQPFNVKITIAGTGNFKIMEAPKLNLPEGIETFKTQSRFKYNNDLSGYKVFEYLLLSKNPGEIKIPGLKWTYFDPKTNKYETITKLDKILDIKINEATKSVSKNQQQSNTDSLSKFSSGAQKWQHESRSTIFSNLITWLLQLIGLILIAFLFIKRKKVEKSNKELSMYPWKKTLKELEKSKSNNAPLIDRFIRERLLYKISEYKIKNKLHLQSPRNNFISTLLNSNKILNKKTISDLSTKWESLESTRFSGNKQKLTNIDYKEFKTLIEKI